MRDAIQIVNKFLLTGTVHFIDPIHTPITRPQNTKDHGATDNGHLTASLLENRQSTQSIAGFPIS